MLLFFFELTENSLLLLASKCIFLATKKTRLPFLLKISEKCLILISHVYLL